MNHRDELPSLLTSLNLVGRGVEVGVFKGDFAEVILRGWPGHLVLVDLWRQQPWENYPDGINCPELEEFYHETQRRLAPFADRTTFMRAWSVDAAREFADGALDFVYIDANHTGDAVRADLTAWFPKVRRRGLLCGHDYGNNEGVDHVRQVRPTVDAFASEHGLTVHSTKEQHSSWWAQI